MYCLVKNEENTLSLKTIIDTLEKNGIQTRPVWKLMTDLPMFQNNQTNGCEVAKNIQSRIINIPCSTNLTEENIKTIVTEIKNINEQ